MEEENIRCEEAFSEDEEGPGFCSSNYQYNKEIAIALHFRPPSSLSAKYPLHKLLHIVALIFQFNLFQALVFRHSLSITNWDFIHLTSTQALKLWPLDIPGHSKDGLHQLQVMLYLMAWRTKLTLNNKPGSLTALQNKICKRMLNFKKIYAAWCKQLPPLEMGLCEINTLFYQHHQHASLAQPNFNRMVDKILDLSTAYNTRQKTKKQPKKQVLKRQHVTTMRQDQENRRITRRTSTIRSMEWKQYEDDLQMEMARNDRMYDSRIDDAKEEMQNMMFNTRYIRNRKKEYNAPLPLFQQ